MSFEDDGKALPLIPRTLTPASVKANAVLAPTIPPPITQTSVAAAAAAAAVASERDAAHATGRDARSMA